MATSRRFLLPPADSIAKRAPSRLASYPKPCERGGQLGGEQAERVRRGRAATARTRGRRTRAVGHLGDETQVRDGPTVGHMGDQIRYWSRDIPMVTWKIQHSLNGMSVTRERENRRERVSPAYSAEPPAARSPHLPPRLGGCRSGQKRALQAQLPSVLPGFVPVGSGG